MIKHAGDKRRYLADLSLFLTALVWGLSFTILKNILGTDFSPIVFILIRFFVAAVVILPLCFRRLKQLDRMGFIGSLALGGLLFSGFALQSIGIQYTLASKSAFITGLSALFVPLFLFLHKRRFTSPVNTVAILAAVGGMYLLTDPSGGGINYGDILTLICAAIFGAHIYVMGIVTRERDFLSITFVQLSTVVVLAAIFLPLEQVKFNLSGASISAVIYLAVLATAAALAVQAWAQQRTSAVKAGLIFTAEPVFAYMFASILLGEFLNPLQKAGGAIIVLAVIASEAIPAILMKKKGQWAIKN